MSKKITFSVIVPVYNKEKVIDKTLLSLSNVLCDDVEFIIVNDGSTDKSEEIIVNYVRNDDRFKYYCTKNKGVSHARNYGINHACGEYIIFVDADDKFKGDILSKIKTIPKSKANFIQYNYNINKKTNDKITKIATNSLVKFNEDLFKKLLTEEIINSVWSKCFKLEVLNDHNLRFEEGISMGEDLVFSATYFLIVKEIFIMDRVGYDYTTGVSESLTNKKGYSKYIELEKAFNVLEKNMRDSSMLSDKLIKECVDFLREKRLLSEFKLRLKNKEVSNQFVSQLTYALKSLDSGNIKHKILKRIIYIISTVKGIQ